MPWVIKKNGKTDKPWCVYKEGGSEALGCHDSKDKAEKQVVALYASEGKSLEEAAELAAKCYYDDYTYVPWGTLTFADALAAEEAQEAAKHVEHLARMYKQIVDNILGSQESDKGKRLKALADEFAELLDGSEAKSTGTDVTGMEAESGESQVPPAPEDDDLNVIKSIGQNRVRGYAVLWGSESETDLTGEYFDPQTEELTAIFDAVGKLPFIYNHALDDTLKTAVIGVVDAMGTDQYGLWYEAQLQMASEYEAYVKKLLEGKKLKTSSQTFARARRVSAKGRIERWPIVEITATPTPAEYRMPPIDFIKSAYAQVGCDDFECILKTYGEADDQGAEKARLELELARLQLSFIEE